MSYSGKTIVYVDMDHVLCDYDAGFKIHQEKYPHLVYPQELPGLYVGLEPISGAIETFTWLSTRESLAVFILTAPSIKNPHCYSEKREWVEKHLGFDAVKNLIISPHKGLNKGDFLIDDCTSGKGQEYFDGTLIHFGSEEFPDWASIRTFFENMF